MLDKTAYFVRDGLRKRDKKTNMLLVRVLRRENVCALHHMYGDQSSWDRSGVELLKPLDMEGLDSIPLENL
ncbi:hypothetical protein Tco_1257736 [Tanacetum coccineum]